MQLSGYFPRMPHAPVTLTDMRTLRLSYAASSSFRSLSRLRVACDGGAHRGSCARRLRTARATSAQSAWSCARCGSTWRGRERRASLRPSRPDLCKVCPRRDVRALGLLVARDYRRDHQHGASPPCLGAVRHSRAGRRFLLAGPLPCASHQGAALVKPHRSPARFLLRLCTYSFRSRLVAAQADSVLQLHARSRPI